MQFEIYIRIQTDENFTWKEQVNSVTYPTLLLYKEVIYYPQINCI